jgi:hypothetical protein
MTFEEAVAEIDMDWLERDKQGFIQAIRDSKYIYDPSPDFALIRTEYPEVFEIRKTMTPERYANIEQWTQEDWIDHWIAWMI